MQQQLTATQKNTATKRLATNGSGVQKSISMPAVPVLYNTVAIQLKDVEKEELLQKKPFQLKRNPLTNKAANEEGAVSQQMPFQLAKDKPPVNEIAPQNQTGIPDGLKSGIEALSGIAIDDVKVHYNSAQPAQLNALAYAQGTNIHIAPGQEKHLPHEAWHVVQQKQGRVRQTMQMKGGVAVNDDASLEHEAEVMGEKARNSLFSGANPRHLGKPPFQNSSEHKGVLITQTQLDPKAAIIIHSYIRDTLKVLLRLMNPQALGKNAAMWNNVMKHIAMIETNAVNNFHHLTDAASYVDAMLARGFAQVMGSLSSALSVSPRDPAFKKLQWDYLTPPMAHMQSAGVFQNTLLDSTYSPGYQANRNNVSNWMQNPAISLKLFQKVHESIQKILWLVNIRHAKEQVFKITDGEELLNSVGRLSMMIADIDFLPFWDTRPLPMNWTTDFYLESRAESRQEYTPEQLEQLKKNTLELRKSIKPADFDPENKNKGFRYEGAIPSGKGHNTKLHSEGALRLDFDQGQRILDQVNPGADNDDLSYENIVKYLKQVDGAILRSQLRRVFSDMNSADPFLRELAILLVGIEGTQNNMMALHGPMVTDLVSQGEMQWGDALFTGERTPDLAHMPFFVYASDATQKGTDDSNKQKGPMVRQSELIKTGKIDAEAFEQAQKFRRDQQIRQEDESRRMEYVRERIVHLDNRLPEEFRAKENEEQEKIRLKNEAWRQKQDVWLREQVDKNSMSEEQAAEEMRTSFEARIRDENAAMAKRLDVFRGRQDAERAKQQSILHKEYNKTEEHKRLEQELKSIGFNSTPANIQSVGYDIFLNVYMQQQFNLMNRFINVFFPQIHFLDFGQNEKGQNNFVDFSQRLVEYYMMHRFYSGKDKGEQELARWHINRQAIERFLSLRAGSKEDDLHQHNLTPALALQWYLARLVDSEFMVNNCLIYAIAGAAGIKPGRNDIYTLRLRLQKMAGEDLGNQLDFNQQNVAIIMAHFGLTGTVNLYTGDAREITATQTYGQGGNIYKIFYANRHFTTHNP